MTKGTIEVGGLTRTYLTYVPLGLTKGAPLVVVMHGSGQNGAQTREWTGYGFERLADERGLCGRPSRWVRELLERVQHCRQLQREQVQHRRRGVLDEDSRQAHH